jgi:hypothetical protein
MVTTASDIASRMIQPTGAAPCAGCGQQVETAKVLGRTVYACDDCANRRCDWCGRSRKPSAYAGDDVAGLIDICQWCRGTETRRNGTARTTKTIAALFVQPDGCYAGLPFVDAWPESRDARKYDGDLPVVAHPPCQLWGNLCAVNFARWGGEHNRPGNDGGCFASAVANVRRCGGVLEHPAMSKAFAAHGITPPVSMGWQRVTCGGWVCEVWQSAYGHRANKATWLYYFGEAPPEELRWERIRGTHQVGMQCRQGIRASEPWRNKPSLSKREANATPIEFRDAMIALALQARKPLQCEKKGNTVFEL